MKTQFLKSLSCGLIFSAVLFSTACKENEILTPEATEKQDDDRSAKLGIPTKFDQVGFAQRIENYLEPKVAGFGYSIFNDGKEYFNTNGGDGAARKQIESSFQAHGAIVKQETLKTTQYVTALAVLRILKKYNLSLSTKVWPYLPKSWNPSDKFKTLDFERLLAHRTGLINYNDFVKIKLTVEGPVNEPIFNNVNIRENNDINYLLLGIITPYVEAVELKKQGNSTKLNELNASAESFSVYGAHFREIVRANVFVPAGLENATIIDWQAWGNTGPISSSLGTKGYPAKTGNEPGISKGINRLNCGVTGLYLSASQFAKLQSAVAQFKVVSMADLGLMKTKLMGFDGKLTGTKGSYFYKASIGDNNETIIFDFGKIQVAIFANSPESDLSDPTVVAMMFENSFIPL
jgi:hypothetical protein